MTRPGWHAEAVSDQHELTARERNALAAENGPAGAQSVTWRAEQAQWEAERKAREAHELALAGRCSHGGHGWEGTCSDIDDALAGRRPRLSPAEELAAEFGQDVSEWTV